MVYAYTQDVPIDAPLYQRILDELGPEPLAGSLLHLCVRRPDGGLRYIDVWESEQACTRAFDERVHPAVDRAFGGSRPDGEPVVTRLDVIDARVAARRDVPVNAPAQARGAAVRFPFPPLLFAGPLAAALLVHWAAPWAPGGGPATTIVGIVLVVTGLLMAASGVATVLRQGTTVVPHHRVSRLVTHGPYRLSRNPMYTGTAVAYAGAALWVGSWWPLLLLPLCVLATSRLVVRPEEVHLAERFGADYARYRARVRRWL